MRKTLTMYAAIILLCVTAAFASAACFPPDEEVTVLETVELHGPAEVFDFFSNDVPQDALLQFKTMDTDPSAAVPRVCYWMEIRPHVGMWVYIYLN